jgi:acetylornithine/N-succinyldiaminopimelate aminotransferase
MIKGFHGRTITTMSATGKEQWNTLFAPKTPGFIHVRGNAREALEMMVSEKTCAVMLEPVHGEGGVNIASNEYLNWLSDYCAKKRSSSSSMKYKLELAGLEGSSALNTQGYDRIS